MENGGKATFVFNMFWHLKTKNGKKSVLYVGKVDLVSSVLHFIPRYCRLYSAFQFDFLMLYFLHAEKTTN